MTALNITQAIDLLNQARMQIEQGETKFICYALGDVSQPENWPTCLKLTHYITDCLDPCEYFGEWLMNELKDCLPSGILTQARLAWIDRMIYQLELDGTLP